MNNEMQEVDALAEILWRQGQRKHKKFHISDQLTQQGIDQLDLHRSKTNSIVRITAIGDAPFQRKYSASGYFFNRKLIDRKVTTCSYHHQGRQYEDWFAEISKDLDEPLVLEGAIFSSRPLLNEVRSSLVYRGNIVRRSLKVEFTTSNSDLDRFWRQSRFYLAPKMQLSSKARALLCTDRFGVGLPTILNHYKI